MYHISLAKPELKKKGMPVLVKILIAVAAVAAVYAVVKYFCKKHNIKCPVCNAEGGCNCDECDCDYDDDCGDDCGDDCDCEDESSCDEAECCDECADDCGCTDDCCENTADCCPECSCEDGTPSEENPTDEENKAE